MKPIIFNTGMVRAILDGIKTQTRRPVKTARGSLPAGHYIGEMKKGGNWCSDPREDVVWAGFYEYDRVFYANGEKHIDASYYKSAYMPGSVLWVRETWNGCMLGNGKIEYWYKADGEDENHDDEWRPSIHMPRAAARIFLKVTDVKVERLQDISIDDAVAEGCFSTDGHGFRSEARNLFREKWDTIYAKKGFGWDVNPWVWVFSFKRTKAPE